MEKFTDEEINNCKRRALRKCYLYADRDTLIFRGEVSKIRNGQYFFNELFLEYMTDTELRIEKEDKIWIHEARMFVEADVQLGECIEFFGEVVPYRKENGSCELMIADAHEVERMDHSELPRPSLLGNRPYNTTRCDECPNAQKCDGVDCIYD